LSRKRAFSVVAALAVSGCGIRPQGATTGPSPAPTQHRGIFATSRSDEVHQLSLAVDVAPHLRAPAGITPIQVTLYDPSRRLVRDAIVYVVLDSETGRTPKMTVVASNREDGTYTAELPLVYDSAWRFTVKAFSNGRSGIVTVVEDTN